MNGLVLREHLPGELAHGRQLGQVQLRARQLLGQVDAAAQAAIGHGPGEVLLALARIADT